MKTAPLAAVTRAERGRRVKDAILAGAAALFGESGYDGVTLDHIAERSGAARSLILYHFTNKEGVWTQAVDRVADLFHARFAEQLAQIAVTNDIERLRAMITVSIDVMTEIPQYGQILVREGGRPGPRLDWLARRFSPPVLRFEDAALADRIRYTLVRDVLIGSLLTITALGPLIEASLSITAGRKRAGIRPLSPESRDELVELLVAMIAPQSS